MATISKKAGWGGKRANQTGRPPGTTILPATVKRIEERTTRYERTDTPTKNAIVEALKSVSTSTLSRWLDVMYKMPGVEEISIEKTHHSGKVVEIGRIKPGEIPTEQEQAAGHFISTWREGEFHLRIIHEGDYVGQRRTLTIGGLEALDKERLRGQRSTLEDAQADIAEATKALALQAQLSALKQATGGGDEEMKPDQLLMLAGALKQPPTDLTPILTVMEASRREAAERAERMEQRNHELQMEMMKAAREEKKADTSTGLTALTALLPHASGLLDNPFVKGLIGKVFARAPEPAGGWTPDALMGIVSTIANAAGPYIGPLIAQMMARNGQPQAEQPTTTPALNPPPQQNGGAPQMPGPIFDVIVAEFRKPRDDRGPSDHADLAEFMSTLPSPVVPGMTMLDWFHAQAATKEHFANVGLRQFDARFGDEQTWPGVLAFLGYLREQATAAQAAEEKTGDVE